MEVTFSIIVSQNTNLQSLKFSKDFFEWDNVKHFQGYYKSKVFENWVIEITPIPEHYFRYIHQDLKTNSLQCLYLYNQVDGSGIFYSDGDFIKENILYIILKFIINISEHGYVFIGINDNPFNIFLDDPEQFTIEKVIELLEFEKSFILQY